MAWFSKKTDPIKDRARALSQEIAQLEAQIKQLDARLQHEESNPTAVAPQRSTSSNPGPWSAPEPRLAPQEPIFEEVDRQPLRPGSEPAITPDHFNELGVRKYDLPALLQRIRNHFRGPSTSNPKLVSYLAAGGIQGLRPLRYERRVARNRFIFFSIGLLLILLVVLSMVLGGH
jgi:hypothetical protein